MGKAKPHFILEGASRFDIQQGEAGKDSPSLLRAVDQGRLLKVSLWIGRCGDPQDSVPAAERGPAPQGYCRWTAMSSLQPAHQQWVYRAIEMRHYRRKGENGHRV